MDLGLKGKVVVVTASSRGLGKAVAEAVAAEGGTLAVCSRDPRAIEATAESLKRKYNSEVLAVSCDVRRAADVKNFAERVFRAFGSVHVLFANAGGPPPGKADDFSPDDYHNAIDLNLMSTIRLVEAFLPPMKKQNWGRIIASTSITVKQPLPNLVLSNVSRAGVIAYIKSIAREYGGYNITANAVAPGYILTDRVKQVLNAKAEKEGIGFDEALRTVTGDIPAGRIGTPDEFASLVVYLASMQAAYINGVTVLIDGGQYQGLM